MDIENGFKKITEETFLYRLLLFYRGTKAQKKQVLDNKNIIKQWVDNGKPVPPPHIYKISTVKYYSEKFRVYNLIETGTYLGDTIEACKNIFKKIISIELDKQLYENAKTKFSKDSNIAIYQGDSGDIIGNVLSNMSEPCLFWLDGHYSEGITAKGELNTPILNELKHIFAHSIETHVILIDDARCFTGNDDYPSIETLKALTNEHDPKLKFSVEDDIIRIHP